MNYTGARCANCKQPLAPGERSCKNCGEYRSQGNGNAGPMLSLYSPQTGVPIPNWPTQPGVLYENPREKIPESSKSSAPLIITIPKKRKLFVLLGSVLGIILLLMVGSFALGRYSAKVGNKSAHVNTLTTAPTSFSKVGQPVPAGVMDQNTRLTCDCDDPIRVTVTKVRVDQADGGKMIWSMTIRNDSGSFLYYSAHFTLEDQQGKTFIGTGLPQSSDFSPGKSEQVDVTFPLAPVRGVPYMLNGTLIIGGDYLQVNFQPAQFIF